MAEKIPTDKSTSDKELLRVARERFKLAEEAESEIRKLALEDLRFRAGDQWPEGVKAERDRENRPCLTINRTPQFVRQITNDQRQNRPSAKVSPVDDKADIDTAKILQGIVRHIEYNSNADIAYDTAFEGAVVKSFGFWRVITDYVDPMSFEQEILIKAIRNHFQVYLDPHHQEPDGSDAAWGFVFEDIDMDEYKDLYPDSELSSMNDWRSIGDSAPGWMTEKTARVAEYFYIQHEKKNIVQLSTGDVFEESKLPKSLPPGVQVKSKRTTMVPVVKWCKLNGIEILEETDWLGKWIPIIPVYGDTFDVDGKVIREGIVRHAKDSQRMYNYMVSTEAETIGLAPRAPWIIAEGQIHEDNEDIWKTANTRTHSYLPYKPTSIDGSPVSPPVRNAYEAPVQAITNARMQAADDIKATTGIYDSALGAAGNEKSGIAIQRRNQQTQTSNFHFVDNLTRSMKHTCRILVDLIPKIYDTARAVRIIGEDGEEDIVKINQLFTEDNGQEKSYHLGAGKYDVTVSTGPGYETKRQEAVAAMLDMTRSAPQLMQYAGDLLVKNMDWPGAQEIADRIKKGMPPNITDDGKGQPPVPPQVQNQLAQMSQMIDQLTQTTKSQTEIINTKKLELESKERIALATLETNMRIELLKLSSKEAMPGFEHELAQLQRRQDMLHFGQSIEDERSGPDQAATPNEMQASPQQQQMPHPQMPPQQPQQQPPTSGSSLG